MDINTQITNRASQDTRQSTSTLLTSLKDTSFPVAGDEPTTTKAKASAQLHISPDAVSLNQLMQHAEHFLRPEPPPRYLPLSIDQVFIDQAVTSVRALTEGDIDEPAFRAALKDKYNIPDSRPTPNPSATSGNVFDFLTKSDKDELQAAYYHARENNLDLDDVELAAALLAIDRRRKAAISAGTTYIFHTPTENAGQFVPETSRTNPHSASTRVDNSKSELIERVQSHDLFMDNQYLN